MILSHFPITEIADVIPLVRSKVDFFVQTLADEANARYQKSVFKVVDLVSLVRLIYDLK